MAQKSGFFNAQEISGVFDRVYDASDFANYFANFISNGVFATPTNQLKVVAKNGLIITVRSGKAFINGWWYELDEDIDLTIPPNRTAYQTNTVVCCGLNKSERKIDIYLRNNTNETLPVRTQNVHELVIAVIKVGAGVATITDVVITDTRPNSQYCGFVSGLIDQIDETELFEQYDTMFGEWFNGIKGKLGEDIAGQLQLQIDTLSQNITQRFEGLPNAIVSTNDPDNSQGKNGDIWIKVLS